MTEDSWRHTTRPSAMEMRYAALGRWMTARDLGGGRAVLLSEPNGSQARGISTRHKKESGLQNSRNTRLAPRGVCAHTRVCTCALAHARKDPKETPNTAMTGRGGISSDLCAHLL